MFPGLSETSLTVPLIPNGTETLDARNNFDLRFGRQFKVSRFTFEGITEIFNVLNSSTALAVRSTNFGTPTYHQPGGSGDVGTRGAIPYARFVKFGLQARW